MSAEHDSLMSRRRLLQVAGGAVALGAGSSLLGPDAALAAGDYSTKIPQKGTLHLTRWVQGARVKDNYFKDGRFRNWATAKTQTATFRDVDGQGTDDESFLPGYRTDRSIGVYQYYWMCQGHRRTPGAVQDTRLTLADAATRSGTKLVISGPGTVYIRQYVPHLLRTLPGRNYTLSADLQLVGLTMKPGASRSARREIGVGTYIDYQYDYEAGAKRPRQPLVNSVVDSTNALWRGLPLGPRMQYGNTFFGDKLDADSTPSRTRSFQGFQAAITFRLMPDVQNATILIRQMRLAVGSNYTGLYDNTF